MHVLDQVLEYRAADRMVFVRPRGEWRPGQVTAWHRTTQGWIAQVLWRTGPPIFSSCVDFLPASEVVDAGACLNCVVASGRWRRDFTSVSAVE